MQSLLFGVVLLLAAVKLLFGSHGWSGMGFPPQFGDFEAQRHWKEITINLPLREWYVDSRLLHENGTFAFEANNGSFWPIDYPPLSAYHAWIGGKLSVMHTPNHPHVCSSDSKR